VKKIKHSTKLNDAVSEAFEKNPEVMADALADVCLNYISEDETLYEAVHIGYNIAQLARDKDVYSITDVPSGSPDVYFVAGTPEEILQKLTRRK